MLHSSLNNCGLILLAAGSSSRLRQPKQLLHFKNNTLLQHSLDAATGSLAQPIVVVVGANSTLIKKGIGYSRAYIVYNTGWNEGISSSIRTGLSELLHIAPGIQRAIFMVCDQPYISSILLNGMISLSQRNSNGIIACTYHNTMGTPVLFSRQYFPELMLLNGHEGAKNLLKKYPDKVETIPFEMGEVDIDTIEDYEKLVRKHNPVSN